MAGGYPCGGPPGEQVGSLGKSGSSWSVAFPAKNSAWAVAGGLDSATAVVVSSPKDSAWVENGGEGTGGAIATVADHRVGASVAESSSSPSSETLSWSAELLESTAVDFGPKTGGDPGSWDGWSGWCASAVSAPSI